MNYTWIKLIAFLFCADSLAAKQPRKPAINMASQWESSYVSEGRNNLPDGGIAVLDVSTEWTNLMFNTWFAAGSSESYQELIVTAAYQRSFERFSFYAGYSRLQFLQSKTSDNELAAGFEISNIPHITPAAAITYSTGARGSFLELSVSSEQTLLSGKLVLTPYLLQGLDFGYASVEHHGINHFHIGLELTVPLNLSISLVGSLSHSFAQEDVSRDGLHNVSWFTVGLQGAF